MIYFANPTGAAVVDAMRAGRLAMIDTPKQGNRRPAGVTWCADNGRFGKGWPGYEGWWGWLEAQQADAARCLFAVAPDVVGDAAATLDLAMWLSLIREAGFPSAYVAQNGQEHLPVPWDDLDVLFLGGSLECPPCAFVWPADQRPARKQSCPTCGRPLTEWKLGAAARVLVAEAKARGKGVHMGRVNSRRRMLYAQAIGCDTCDGTTLTFGADRNLPQVLSWVADAAEQARLC